MTPAATDALPERLFSREEYRRWYDRQALGRYERVDGLIVGMALERGAHLRVKAAVFLALHRAVREAGLPCQTLPDGATIATGESDFEPDATVNCGTPMSDNAIEAPNPVIVVEVLSPGTASVDTGLKLAGYFRVPPIAHYLIVNPLKRSVIHHRRLPDGIETRIVASGLIAMDPPGIAISVEDIYADG